MTKLKNKSGMVTCIRSGQGELSDAAFESLREGDTVFVGTRAIVVGEDAHYSGDASYDGYLFYDTDGEAWFPEDLD